MYVQALFVGMTTKYMVVTYSPPVSVSSVGSSTLDLHWRARTNGQSVLLPLVLLNSVIKNLTTEKNT